MSDFIHKRPIIFMSEIDLYDSQVKQELQNWKPRQRHIPIVEFNHQPLFRKPEEDENSYLSDKTLTPDELDVDEEDKFGAVFDQINQGIKDLRDSLMNNSTTGPNLQVDSDTTSSTLRSARILKPSAKNQAYSINTELHATFDVPASRFKGNTTDFKLLARNFIEKTKQVYKLKIAIRNRELETANRAGDVNIVKRLRSEESELANEFIQWKQATKRHYKLMLASLKDVQKLQETIADLRRKIQHVQREAERLCSILEMEDWKNKHIKRGSLILHRADKTVQTTSRLNPVEVKTPEPSYFHNSSMISLIDDDNILEIPHISNDRPSSHIPQIDLSQLKMSENPTELQLSGKALSIENEGDKTASTANTENDVSSIAFDKPVQKIETSFDQLKEDYAIEEVELLDDAALLTPPVDEQLVNIEEIMEKNDVIEAVIEKKEDVFDDSNVVKQKEAESDSVVSELASNALDNSLADLDTPVQDSPPKKSSSLSVPKEISSNTDESKVSKQSDSVSSLQSIPSASDNSVLKVKSFQVSSEIQSSSSSSTT